MKWMWSAALVAAAALAAEKGPAQAEADDPLLRPVAAKHAAQWLGARSPRRVHGNSYLVGFEGLNVGLIRTTEGLILIDGAVPQAVTAIEANIRRLGFRIEDVALILSTEPHYDHAGGIAALARDSGATVVASAEAAEVLRRGRSGPDDPQEAHLPEFPPVTRLRVVRDGEAIRLGDTVVTARATPGHTAGSMSWTWRSCEERDCVDMVFASSLNPVSAEGWRFSDPAHRSTVEAFRHTFQAMRGWPCDFLITAHPASWGVDASPQEAARAEAEGGACRAYVDAHEARLEERLAQERGTAD